MSLTPTVYHDSLFNKCLFSIHFPHICFILRFEIPPLRTVAVIVKVSSSVGMSTIAAAPAWGVREMGEVKLENVFNKYTIHSLDKEE